MKAVVPLSVSIRLDLDECSTLSTGHDDRRIVIHESHVTNGGTLAYALLTLFRLGQHIPFQRHDSGEVLL